MGFFRQIKDSFLNFDAYGDFARQSRWKTFRYLLMLMLAIFIIQSGKVGYELSAGQNNLLNSFRTKVPDFTLSGGVLTVHGRQPIIIQKGSNPALVVDTNPGADRSLLETYREGVFIFRDRVVTKQTGQPLSTMEFAPFRAVTVDKADLLAILPWVLLITAVFAFVVRLVWALVATMFVGALGLSLRASLKEPLNFAATWNVAVYAFTLPWLLGLLKFFFFPAFAQFWLVEWALATYIAIRGIRAAGGVGSA